MSWHTGCPSHCPGRPHRAAWVTRAAIALVALEWAGIAGYLLWLLAQ